MRRIAAGFPPSDVGCRIALADMTQLDVPENRQIEPDPDGPDFHEQLAAARGGDQEALDALFQRFYPRVQRMVHHSLATDLRTNRPWLTARFSTGDVVQEVFRSVLKDLEVFEGRNEHAFVGYLAMIVRNRILDAIRFHEAARRDGRRGSVPAEDSRLPSGEDDPAEARATEEEMRRFHDAVGEFPERERLLLRARFEQAESVQNLAEQLGYTSPSAARRAFYAAQARLALMLRED